MADIPLDPAIPQNDVRGMVTRKTVKKAPTAGAVLAAQYRARANGLSNEERQRHRARALSLIYRAT